MVTRIWGRGGVIRSYCLIGRVSVWGGVSSSIGQQWWVYNNANVIDAMELYI